MDMNQQPGSTAAVQPVLGIFAVLLGASLATFFGRLLSVGISDIRGAMGLDVDSASWISTSYNMAMMFIGPFSVYLGGILGARRVLLGCACVFTLVSVFMPFAGSLGVLIALLVLGGLSAGTFYPLTLSFILRNLPQRLLPLGIAAYAMDIVVSTHVAHSYEGWVVRSLSWQWLFWTISWLTPLMIAFVFYGIPRQPLPKPQPGHEPPSWRGFLYASLGVALLYGALDQGVRLDWWRSGTFVAMFLSGLFLLIVTGVRHFTKPNPLVDFPFLRRWNTVLLGFTVMMFRFALLASVVLVPSYLSTIQGYRPEQTGPVLLWLAIPQLLAGAVAVYLLGRIDSRLILAAGFTLIAIGCLVNARITTLWSGDSFTTSQLVLSFGEGLAFSGMVGTIVLDILNSASMESASAALSFGGFFQTARLFGGELGASFIQFLLHRRQVFHYDILAAHLDGGSPQMIARSHLLSAAMKARSTTGSAAIGRSATLLLGSVKQQAFTLSVTDSFLFIAYVATASLLVVACLRPLKIGYRQIIAASDTTKGF